MYPQLASAEFQIGTTTETVTVENVPYTWDSAVSDRDSQASYAVASYIGKHKLSYGKAVTLRWVTSSWGG